MQVSKLLLWALALVLLGSSFAAQDVRLQDRKTRWRFTGEYFGVNGNEDLGLVGVHYDILEPLPSVPDLYVGVGGYAAVAGKHGGLFAGGLSAGYLKEFAPRWMVDLGIFAGGGGGGVAGTGGEAPGLMLRPHVAVEHTYPLFALRLELANVNFLDDEIDDLHLALGLTLPSEVLDARQSGRAPPIPDRALIKRKLRFSPVVSLFSLATGQRRVSGKPLNRDIQTAGVRIDYFLGRHFYLPIEARAATSGSVSGFGMLMTGLGFSLPIAFRDRLRLEASALAGAGGGGDVDTIGGLMWEARAGVQVPIWGPLSLGATYGTTEAVRGSFEANVLTAGLTWSSHIPELAVNYPRTRLQREGLPEDSAKINTTRLQILNKLYAPTSAARHVRGGEYEKTLNLIGVGIEQPVSNSFAILGRAYAAWEGDVGGYVEGLFGAKYEFAPFEDERHHFFLSGEVGAGGGGDMDVGSGLIYQMGAGYRLQLTERASLSLEAAHMQPDRGSFRAETYQIGINWDLQRAFLK